MYHYTECGLDNVYLKNGFIEADTDYGKAYSVVGMEDLHKVIGESIIAETAALNGQEIRFLLKELDLSQKHLANILGITDQTVARWEKNERTIPRASDLVLRTYFSESVSGDSKIANLIQQLTELDRKQTMQKLIFEESHNGWHTENAA